MSIAPGSKNVEPSCRSGCHVTGNSEGGRRRGKSRLCYRHTAYEECYIRLISFAPEAIP